MATPAQAQRKPNQPSVTASVGEGGRPIPNATGAGRHDAARIVPIGMINRSGTVDTCSTSAVCRMTAVYQSSLQPPIAARASDLRDLAKGNAHNPSQYQYLNTVLCPCGQRECVNYPWLEPVPPAGRGDYSPISVGGQVLDFIVKSVMGGRPLGFRIQWSTTISFDKVFASEGVLSYRYTTAPPSPNFCAE